MTVISKFEKLFPKCKVWMIEAYETNKIPFIDFDLHTEERSINIFPVKDVLKIKSILFENKCFSVEVNKDYFSEEEHKELLLLSKLNLQEYSHEQMEDIINLKV